MRIRFDPYAIVDAGLACLALAAFVVVITLFHVKH